MKPRARKGSRGIGEHVAYDPDAHRDFVTGFRKRKEARRLEARANAEKLAKEERRQLRKEKREFIQKQRDQILNADADSEDEDEDDIEERDPNATVQHFENPDGALVTAVVAPLDAPFPFPAQADPHNDGEESGTNQPIGSETLDGSETVSPNGDSEPVQPLSSTSELVGGKSLLKASAPVRKPKWHRRHISYTHSYHKRRAKNKGKGRTTHSERRKRQ